MPFGCLGCLACLAGLRAGIRRGNRFNGAKSGFGNSPSAILPNKNPRDSIIPSDVVSIGVSAALGHVIGGEGHVSVNGPQLEIVPSGSGPWFAAGLAQTFHLVSLGDDSSSRKDFDKLAGPHLVQESHLPVQHSVQPLLVEFPELLFESGTARDAFALLAVPLSNGGE